MLDIAKLSPALKYALVNRGHTDDDIRTMSPREAFVEYCEWNGMIRWGDALWENAKVLIGMEPQAHALQQQAEKPLGIILDHPTEGKRLAIHGCDVTVQCVDGKEYHRRFKDNQTAADSRTLVAIFPSLWEKLPELEDADDREIDLAVTLRDVANASSELELRNLIKTAFDETDMPMSVSFDYFHYGAWADRASECDRPRLAVLCAAAWQRETTVREFGSDTVQHDEDKLDDDADEIMRSYESQWEAAARKPGINDLYYGKIMAQRGDVVLLDSFGITLGDYDEKLGAFYAEVPISALDQLKKFPADFQHVLYLRSDALIASDKPQEEYSVDELMAEKAYCEWWLNGQQRAEREVTKHSKITDMEVILYQVNTLLEMRLKAPAPRAGRDAAPMPS